jgi:hypothetical protein
VRKIDVELVGATGLKNSEYLGTVLPPCSFTWNLNLSPEISTNSVKGSWSCPIFLHITSVFKSSL